MVRGFSDCHRRSGEVESKLDRDTNLRALANRTDEPSLTPLATSLKSWSEELVRLRLYIGRETMPFRSHFHPDKIDSRTRSAGAAGRDIIRT